MLYLLFQMFLYMLVTLLLGVLLGWLLWRRGYARQIMSFFGMDVGPEMSASGSASAGIDGSGSIALQEENERLAGELSRANAERSQLQHDLDDCRATGTATGFASPAAAAVVSTGAAAAAAPSIVREVAASKPVTTVADLDAGMKPAGIDGPRGGRADDLKRIKGIGPKLEKMLHGMGFYHFDQIAQWGPSELAWVDDNLEGFTGRATRDEWVRQAKELA